MSKKRRAIEKQKKEKQRQAVRAAKEKRQQNSPIKWREKKEKKRNSQVAVKESKFPGISKECWLEPFQNPQPKYCGGCGVICPYNPNNEEIQKQMQEEKEYASRKSKRTTYW